MIKDDKRGRKLMNELLKTEVFIESTLPTVWNAWNNTQDIKLWYHASNAWFCLEAVNDLKIGRQFSYRLEAIDGSRGFDFSGEYLKIIPMDTIVYQLEDGRKVEISFKTHENTVHLVQVFEADPKDDLNLQKTGWQNILNNFKVYVEN